MINKKNVIIFFVILFGLKVQSNDSLRIDSLLSKALSLCYDNSAEALHLVNNLYHYCPIKQKNGIYRFAFDNKHRCSIIFFETQAPYFLFL